jgi:hypothetical protein
MIQIQQRTATRPVRSHRPNEPVDHYLRRLASARLTKQERHEISEIYVTLDAEWKAAGQATRPARAPWSPEDILEWRDLTARERYLDLKGWAQHVARHGIALPPARVPAREEPAPSPLRCDGVHVGYGTIWASPFRIGRDGDAHGITAKYARWLAQQHHLLRTLPVLRGKTRCGCGDDHEAHHADLLFSLAAKSRDELIVWWRATK